MRQTRKNRTSIDLPQRQPDSLVEVGGVSFSPDGKRVAVGSADQTIRVLDARSGTELLALKGHAGGVRGLAFSPDGTRIASGSEDQTVRVWDAQSGAQLLPLKPKKDEEIVARVSLKHEGTVASVSFSPDEKQIVSWSEEGKVRVWTAD